MNSIEDIKTIISTKVKNLPSDKIKIEKMDFSFEEVVLFNFKINSTFMVSSGQKVHQIRVQKVASWDAINDKIKTDYSSKFLKNKVAWKMFVDRFSDTTIISPSILELPESPVNISRINNELRNMYSKTVKYTNKNNKQSYTKHCVPSVNEIDVSNINHLYKLNAFVEFHTGDNINSYYYSFEGDFASSGKVEGFNKSCEICFRLDNSFSTCRKCTKEICKNCSSTVKFKRINRYICSVSCKETYIHYVKEMKLENRMVEEGIYAFARNLKLLSLFLFILFGGGSTYYIFIADYSFISMILFAFSLLISIIPLIYQKKQFGKDEQEIISILGTEPIVTPSITNGNDIDQSIDTVLVKTGHIEEHIGEEYIAKPSINEANVKMVDSSIPHKFIDELNREVRICCYQTARLLEKYCWCGRAISKDLEDIFA